MARRGREKPVTPKAAKPAEGVTNIKASEFDTLGTRVVGEETTRFTYTDETSTPTQQQLDGAKRMAIIQEARRQSEALFSSQLSDPEPIFTAKEVADINARARTGFQPINFEKHKAEITAAVEDRLKEAIKAETEKPQEINIGFNIDPSGAYTYRDQNGDIVYQTSSASIRYGTPGDREGVDPFEMEAPKPVSSDELVVPRAQVRSVWDSISYNSTYGNKPVSWKTEKQRPHNTMASSDIDLFSKTMTTRCILSDDKHNIYYIRCPKDCDLTDREIFDVASRGSDNNFQFLDSLPKSLKKTKEKVQQQQKKKPAPKKEVINGIEFGLKTNKLFDKVTTLEIFLSLINRRITTSQFRGSYVGNTCMKNVLVLNNAVAEFGATTGRVVDGQVEVIGLNSSPHNNVYSSKASFRKFFIPTDNVQVTEQTYFDKLFRFKITGAIESSKMFGAKTAKTKTKGIICPADSMHYAGDRQITDEIRVQTFDFREPSTGNNLRYVASEIEILALNSKYINNASSKINRKIEKGKDVIVIDDRKTGLNKGDIVKVTNITKDASNVKNSILTVMDSKKNKHNILLKQTKVYGNQTVNQTGNKKEENIINF